MRVDSGCSQHAVFQQRRLGGNAMPQPSAVVSYKKNKTRGIDVGFLNNLYNREPKTEIKKDEAPKQGIALFFDVLRREFWGICKLNLVFILFCIPVVTIPTALTAMSRVVMLMIMDKPVYPFGDFFAEFKAEWKRATVAGLVYFPLLALAVYGLYFYANVVDNYILYTLSIVACVSVLIIGFYLFPMLAMLDLKIKEIFKNAVLLTFVRMPQNILTLIIVAALTLLVVMFLPPTIVVVLLIFFALIGYITTFCAYTGLKKHVIKEMGNDE